MRSVGAGLSMFGAAAIPVGFWIAQILINHAVGSAIVEGFRSERRLLRLIVCARYAEYRRQNIDLRGIRGYLQRRWVSSGQRSEISRTLPSCEEAAMPN